MSDAAERAPEVRVRSGRALRGPSLWAPHPVAACEVEVAPALAAADAGALAVVIQRLAMALPELGTASADAAGAAAWAGLVGDVANALQARVGAPAGFARVRPGEHGDPPQLAIGYAEEEVGVESLYRAAELVSHALAGDTPDAEPAITRLREMYLAAHPGPTASALIDEARRRGIAVRRTPGDPVVRLGHGRALRRLDAAMTDHTSAIAAGIASHQHRTRAVLARVGLPVPRGEVARTLADALEIAGELGYPVVVKPLDADDGRGASGEIGSPDELTGAWTAAAAVHQEVIVERYVAGRDHRVLVVAGQVVAVAERVPASVLGDGRRTVRELAEEENRKPGRDPRDPASPRVPLPLDAATGRHLARHGVGLDDVPEAGRHVRLRATAEVSTGGTAVDRTDEMHPRNAALCVLAAGAVGLDIAGIDVLTPDISVPFDENGAAIVGVNASPGIRMHTDPDEGAPRDAAGAILDSIYPPGAPVTVPIVAITGTNGKTTTTRLIAHLFRGTGASVGYATTDGIYFGETLLMEGDFTGPFAAGVVLTHPRVDVAVIETARGGILRGGLGYPAADVGVVLNVTADHLGLKGIHTVEQLAEVKGVIAGVVKPDGFAVLNADDPLVLAMRERTPGQVVLTSIQGAANPEVGEHLSRGGTAAVVEEVDGREWLVIHTGRRGGERVAIAEVAQVPLAMGGAARFQLGNLLAASAAAYVQGMPVETIRQGLRTFIPSGEATPGRMNVMRTARGTVIVDYAHNPAAVRGLMDFVGRMDAGRRIGVVTMPGDRRDDDLREMGRIASVLDYVVVKEHEQYRRGRPAGEVARLIGEGLEAGGFGPAQHEAVLSEPEAVDRAVELMSPGDLVVILADDVTAVLRQIAALGNGGSGNGHDDAAEGAAAASSTGRS